MQINLKHSAVEVIGLYPKLSADSKKRLQVQACKMYGEYMALRIGDFIACTRGDFSHIDCTDDERLTAGQYVWLIGFSEFCEDFLRKLKNLTPPMSETERQASAKCLKTTLAESMLVESRRYFGLHSFSDAENITLGEYLIARKDTYNGKVFAMAQQAIIKQRQKTRR